MNIQTLTDKIKNDFIINKLNNDFDNEIYIVGGSVRDFLTGSKVLDRDLIVLDEDAKAFAQKVAEIFEGKFIPLDEENKIYRVALPDKINYIDITNPVENSLIKDINRRDLTINAIAVNIKTGEIPDICKPFIEDFNDGILKEITEENFTDDPLRLLRVFRFYAKYGFELSDNLYQIIEKYANLIKNPAKERIHEELMKLFNGKYTPEALIKMNECGMLEVLFPFVKELKQVPPNLHHHLNLFYHSIETIYQVQKIYENSCPEVKKHLEQVDFGGFSRLTHLKLAAFMHDIGKFSTWTIEEGTGRHRFIKHEDAGEKLCKPILRALCFSNKQIEYISSVIKRHMYASAVVSSPDLNEKVKMRYIRKSEDNAIDYIIIAQADRLSALGPEITQEIVDKNINSLNSLLNYYLEIKDELEPLPKLLDGKEVMEILNIPPSKKLGEILDKLHDAQISGDVVLKQDAINFIKSL